MTKILLRHRCFVCSYEMDIPTSEIAIWSKEITPIAAKCCTRCEQLKTGTVGIMIPIAVVRITK